MYEKEAIYAIESKAWSGVDRAMKNEVPEMGGSAGAVEPAPLPETDAEALRNRQDWSRTLLRAGRVTPGVHLQAEALEQLVKTRQEKGEAWEMPEHLAFCPHCLAVFESMLAGAEEVPPHAIQRYIDLMKPTQGVAIRRLLPTMWSPRTWVAAAALVALLLGGILVDRLTRHTTLTLCEGVLALTERTAAAVGETVPGRSEMTARTSTLAEFADGTALRIERDTRFSCFESWWGNRTVYLQEGAVDCKVVPQPVNRRFTVATPLGEVQVHGTEFRVVCRSIRGPGGSESDAALRLEKEIDGYHVSGLQVENKSSDPRPGLEQEAIMIVAVKSGVVRVANQQRHADVKVGQTVVIRSRSSAIEVFSAAPPP